MATPHKFLEPFLALSVELCGLSRVRLLGTGCAELYLATVTNIIGEKTLGRLFDEYAALPAPGSDPRDQALRTRILADDELGPIVRNIIKLWYVSTWFQLPHDWHEKFGMYGNDQTFIPSPYAYPESQLWPAVGGHVPGAKPTGYGSWATRPVIPEFKGNDRLLPKERV